MKKSFLLLLICLLSICLFACTPGEKKVEMTFDQSELVVAIEHTAQWDVKDKQGTKLATASLEGGQSFLENDGKHYLLNEESYVLIVNVLPQYSGEDLAISYNNLPLALTKYKRAEHQYRYEFVSAIADKHIFKAQGLSKNKVRMLDIVLPISGATKNEMEGATISVDFLAYYYLGGEDWQEINKDNKAIKVEYDSEVIFAIEVPDESFTMLESIDVKYTMEETYGEIAKSFFFMEECEKEIIGKTIKYTFTATFDILKIEVFLG